jgi:hypothetical protein
MTELKSKRVDHVPLYFDEHEVQYIIIEIRNILDEREVERFVKITLYDIGRQIYPLKR